MKELSLHILDVAQNSISAGATQLDISVREHAGRLRVVIADNGCGMSPQLLAAVTDPFTTTRTTRKVGLGLPLLKLAAEQTGGALTIESEVGAGTTVSALFDAGSIDCPPLGDMASSVSLLVQGAGEAMELSYTRETQAGAFRFDTREMREILGPVPLSEPEIVQWMRDYIAQGEAELM